MTPIQNARCASSLRTLIVSCVGLLACGCATTAQREMPQRLGGRGHDIAFAVAAAPDGGARIAAQLTGPLLGDAIPRREDEEREKKEIKKIGKIAQSAGSANGSAVSRDPEENEEEAEDRGTRVAPADAEALAPFQLPRTRVAAIVAYDARKKARWVLPLSGGGSLVSPRSIAVGKDGTTYAAGWFPRRLEILAEKAPDTLVSRGGADAFVLAVDRDGKPRWLRQIGGPLADNALAITASSDGGCWVVGSFSGTMRGEPADAASLSSAGGSDAYVARFDADGSLRTLRAIGGPGNEEPIAFALAPDGAPYLLMRFTADLDIDTRSGARHLTLQGGDDGLLLRLDGDAAVEAAVAIGSSKPDNLTTLAADANGALVAGTLAGGRELHVGDETISTTSRGAADAMLLRFDRDLRLSAHGSIGGDGTVNVMAATYDARGELWLAGNFNGRLAIGAQTLTADGADGVVLGIDANLQSRHVRVLAGQGVQQIYSLAADGTRLLAAGTFTKELVAVPGVASLVSNGRSDAFFVALTPPR
jgi:hypothetical protein